MGNLWLSETCKIKVNRHLIPFCLQSALHPQIAKENMDSASATHLWFSIINIIAVAAAITTAATNPDPSRMRELEALNSWWPYNNSQIDHCKWKGITCSRGRVAVMNLHQCDPAIPWRRLDDFDALAFPYLTRLHISSACGLNGHIPTRIAYLSQLTYLNLSANQLSGELPTSLQNLTNLQVLDLSHNYNIRGAIPFGIGSLKSLVVLDLSNNKINGSLPPTLAHLTRLESLVLKNNIITGSLPSNLGRLTNLLVLDLSYNLISGSLPWSLGELTSLVALNLSSNTISGSLPSTLGQLLRLETLSLSVNKLEGVLGAGIEKLPSIKMIDLRWNSISGQIPVQFGDAANAESLDIDLSNNNLNGGVPESLSQLKKIDLSYNHLEGRIPGRVWKKFPESSFLGNSKLKLPGVSKARLVQLIISAAAFFACSLYVGILCLWRNKRKRKSLVMPDSEHQVDRFKIWSYNGKTITYSDIIETTEDFDIRYCIGTGCYGSVYRAHLPKIGKVVAVKKLHRFEADNPGYDMCFRNEAKVLSEIRHRNIVKLLGFCLDRRCMFLIYDYLERGSLFCVLRDEVEALELDWIKRVNVVKGTADALCYMHHDCSPPILHRDISSNNILLNSKLEACVSDFGTARLFDPDSSYQTLVAGTRGYIAPGKYLYMIMKKVFFSFLGK